MLAEPRIIRALAVQNCGTIRRVLILNSRHERGSSTLGVNRHGINLNLGSSFQELSAALVDGAFFILPLQTFADQQSRTLRRAGEQADRRFGLRNDVFPARASVRNPVEDERAADPQAHRVRPG